MIWLVDKQYAPIVKCVATAVTTAAAVCVAPFLGRVWRVWRDPPDRASCRHGGQLVADVLAAHGVSFVFTLTGGHIAPVLTACAHNHIRVIDVRHEATAVFAADACARLTGRPGVAAVTAGPGVTNTVTAVQNARLAESPVVLLCGAVATLLRERGALQDIDQLALMRPACKQCFSVERVADIVPTLRRAFSAACSGTPGPVCVQLPIDTLYPYELVRRQVTGGGGARDESRADNRQRSVRQRLTAAFLQLYVDDVFAGAWRSRVLEPLAVTEPTVGSAAVRAAASLLLRSRRPLAVIGSSAVAPGGAGRGRRLAVALRQLGVPCYLAGSARGLLGAECRRQLRHQRRQALSSADTVLLLGAPADFRLGYGRLLPRHCAIVSVHRCRRQLRLNAGLFWRATVAGRGDVINFVERLVDRLGRCGNMARSSGDSPCHCASCACVESVLAVNWQWWQDLHERDAAAHSRIVALSQTPRDSSPQIRSATGTDSRVNPLQLLLRLDAQLAGSSVLVLDGGDFVGSAAYIVRARAAAGWLDPGVFGTLGCGAGFALAAGLVLGARGPPVWLLYGDGACGFSLMELDTLRRHGVAVGIIVGNDACWTQIAREQVALLGSDVACRLEHSRYDLVAEALGARGYLLTHSDQIDRCLEEAAGAVRQGQTALVNALIATTSFREGSISV